MSLARSKPKKITTKRTAPPKVRPHVEHAVATTKPVVYVISDSTGNLARHMLAAFQTQFPPNSLSVHYETFIRSEARLKQVLEKAKAHHAIVCHAIVSPELKVLIADWCKEHDLPCRDLTGGTVEFLAKATGVKPLYDRQALHRMDETYKQRIGALEFTMNHDDALGLETIQEADIVLAGVSRTSKTPTSIYLAQQGFRVANVALAMGCEVPKQLLALPREKVVGFVIDPQQLVMIRNRRQSGWRMGQTNYADPEYVIREMAWIRRLFGENGWAVLDVTDQAIEETAARVLELLGLHSPTVFAGAGDLP